MPSGPVDRALWGRVVALAALAAVLILGPAPPARAAEPSALVPQQAAPRTLDDLPRGFRLTAREAIRIAEREPRCARSAVSVPDCAGSWPYPCTPATPIDGRSPTAAPAAVGRSARALGKT